MKLDVGFTLDHGGKTPVGLARVEADVLRGLTHLAGDELELVRFDADARAFRRLTAAERERALTLAGLSRIRGSDARSSDREAAIPLARRWRRLRGLADAPAFVTGDALISVANPWDRVPIEVFAKLRGEGVSLVLLIHDLLPWEAPHLTAGWEARAQAKAMLAALRAAKRLVAVSQHSADAYAGAMRELGAEPAPVAVAHPALAPFVTEDLPGSRPVGLRAEEPFVLFCSTIEVRKNHLLLLHLWERLRTEWPPGKLPRLVFVGAWGWGVDAVKLFVERNWRLAPHLLVLPETTDAELSWLYRHAGFTMFPSFAEGYGMPVAESLALGTPALISHHPALIEASQGLAPALEPLDIDAWRRETTRLIDDPARLTELREAAKRFVRPPPHGLARALWEAARM